jgi:hypothetical protein
VVEEAPPRGRGDRERGCDDREGCGDPGKAQEGLESGPVPRPHGERGRRAAVTRGPVRAAPTRSGGGTDGFVLWSVEERISERGRRRHAKFLGLLASRGGGEGTRRSGR